MFSARFSVLIVNSWKNLRCGAVELERRRRVDFGEQAVRSIS